MFLIACAKAPNMSSFIAFRFLSGVFGSCPLTNGGGTIADLIRQEKRGAAMAGFGRTSETTPTLTRYSHAHSYGTASRPYHR